MPCGLWADGGHKPRLGVSDPGPHALCGLVLGAEQWAKEEGLLFVEASAKSGHNVEYAFSQASKDILDKVKRGVFDDGRVRFLTA